MAGDGDAGVVIAIVFINDHQIRHLHNSLLDATEVVAPPAICSEIKQSTKRATSVSDCPTPTVSTITTS